MDPDIELFDVLSRPAPPPGNITGSHHLYMKTQQILNQQVLNIQRLHISMDTFSTILRKFVQRFLNPSGAPTKESQACGPALACVL